MNNTSGTHLPQNTTTAPDYSAVKYIVVSVSTELSRLREQVKALNERLGKQWTQ